MDFLRKIQLEFIDSIYNLNDNSFLSKIKPHNVLSDIESIEKLNIYKASTIGGLIKVLQETYPVCVKLVGSKCFDELSQLYIQQNILNTYNIDLYGQNFPEFIKKLAINNQLVYFYDITKLEWAYHIALNSPDNNQFDFAKLNAINNQNTLAKIIFKLVNQATLLASNYPVKAIWLNNQDNCEQKTIYLTENKVRLIIWRDKFDLKMEELNLFEWELLQDICQKFCLAEICNKYPDRNVTAILPDLVAKGWVVDFS